MDLLLVVAIVSGLAAALAAISPAWTECRRSLDVARFRLRNGLRLVVHEDPTPALVSLHLFFRAGSRYEPPGLSGIAHLLEHLLFHGTPRRPAGAFDRILEGSGGTANAFTTPDHTVVHDLFPPDALDTVLDLESDRMTDLRILPRKFETEVAVIREERRLAIEDSPEGALLDLLYAIAFGAHPYGRSVLGSEEGLARVRIDDCRTFHRRRYGPRGAVLVLCGAVRTGPALRLVRARFGGIAAGRRPTGDARTAVPLCGKERRAVLQLPAELPAIALGYPVPSVGDPDLPALRVAAAVLEKGRSSRVFANLVEGNEIALDASVEIDELEESGLAVAYLQARDGVPLERVERAFHREIARLGHEGVAEEELDRAKAQLLAAHERAVETVSGRGEILGLHEMHHGNARAASEGAEALTRVRREEVRRVASQYFRPNNRTVVLLEPHSRRKGT